VRPPRTRAFAGGYPAFTRTTWNRLSHYWRRWNRLWRSRSAESRGWRQCRAVVYRPDLPRPGTYRGMCASVANERIMQGAEKSRQMPAFLLLCQFPVAMLVFLTATARTRVITAGFSYPGALGIFSSTRRLIKAGIFTAKRSEERRVGDARLD